MKQTVFGVVCMLVLTFLAILIMTVYGRNLRQSETDHALAEAVDAAMSNLMETQIDTTTSKDELIGNFMRALLAQINSTSDVEVTVLGADEKKGILSVEVTEHYVHPNGVPGSISEVRTVIFEREQEETAERHTVAFYISDDELYKKYIVPADSVCTIPVPPEKEGKVFSNWRFVTGGTGIAGEIGVTYADGSGSKTVLAAGGLPCCISEDTRLVAVFE